MKKRTSIFALFLIIFSLLLAACKPETVEPTALPSPSESAPTQTLDLPTAEVPAQDSTSSSLVSGELVFWAGGASPYNSSLSERLVLAAQTSGKSYEQVENLTAEQLTPSVRVVAATADPAEIQALASLKPEIQFIAVDLPGIMSTPNLHVITSQAGTLEQQAFLAGYALALTTEDYRVGALTLANDDAGNRTRDSFITGARYFCGLCNSRYMPVDYYPFTAEVTDPNNQAGWQPAADALLAKTVTAMYVQPEISSPELLAYLAARNITIIGVEGQVGLEMAGRVVGLLGSDLIASVEQAVTRLLAGESAAFGGSLELRQVNSEIMTDGKFALFNQIREELLSGFIKDRP